ncbi:MAG TPA: hypothetical protein VMZ50_06215 [Phycisphaerae bacterium]|nr:hypothetical protein [Phycisphaerae bacterium]
MIEAIPLALGDTEPTSLEGPILPHDCLMTGAERAVIYGTHRQGEVPCFGCSRREGCGARVDADLELAAELMGVAVADIAGSEGVYRTCARCGSGIREWHLGGSQRIWRCEGMWRRWGRVGKGRSVPYDTPCGRHLAEAAQ